MKKFDLNNSRCSVALLFLFILNTAVYAPHFGKEAVLDDQAFARQDYRLDYPSLKSYFSNATTQHFSPFYFLANNLLFEYFHNNIRFLHAINLFLHISSCFWIFCMLILLNISRKRALFVSVLFSVHPFYAPNVYHISNNFVSLTGLFLSLCFVCLLKYHSFPKEKYFCLPFSVGFYALALLCHEFAVTACLQIFLIYYLHKKEPLKKSALACAPYLAITVLFVGIWIWKVWIGRDIAGKMSVGELSPILYLKGLSFLLLWYFYRLIYPGESVLIYNVHPESISWLMLLLFLGIFILVFRIVRRPVKEQSLPFWLAWFYVGLFPVTVTTLAHRYMGLIIEPHWLYFPSIGLFVCLSFIISQAMQKIPARFRSIIPAGTLIYFISFSPLYGFAWKNNLNCGHFWLEANPSNVIAMKLLGDTYYGKKDLQKALIYYQMMLENSSYERAEPLSRTASIYAELKDFPSARTYIQKALKADPKSADIHNRFGTIEALDKNYAKAKKHFLEAIRLNKNMTMAKQNLGRVFAAEGDYPRAIEAYTKMLWDDPEFPEATQVKVQLVALYALTKDMDTCYLTAQQLIGQDPDNIYKIIAIFDEIGYPQLAEEIKRTYEQMQTKK